MAASSHRATLPYPSAFAATRERLATYEVPDDRMAAGSTLGSPKAMLLVKATGAIEKFHSIDVGQALFGTVALHHWDARSGIPLIAEPGTFSIHPERQEHRFTLSNGVSVRERIFVLSGKPSAKRADPPAAYYCVELCNGSNVEVALATYASAQLRGDTSPDVRTSYDARATTFFAWNASSPKAVRAFTCSLSPTSYETTLDNGKASAMVFPGALSGATIGPSVEPVAIFHLDRRLRPGERCQYVFTLTFGLTGKAAAKQTAAKLPTADAALARTQAYYTECLDCAVVLTPDDYVNRGVLWAKANMLRVESLAPTGWSFVNDPTRSNNSVARDTAWFAFGSDYVTPWFSRESLLYYAQHLERRGMAIEYYDIRNGTTADYGLNINDDTPLLVLGLWHHYSVTGDEAFLRDVFAAAVKAGRYILSQRDERGLVWCSAKGVADWGIAGWRNVIPNYQLSGAVTEINSECYAALRTISHMAKALKRSALSLEFEDAARALRDAINAHLLNPRTGLYYLNIDLEGNPRTDVTVDLVFPVMFGVADEETAAHVIARLSSPQFWSAAGIHTVPRDDLRYSPAGGWGLSGGVWVGVTFWFAFASARYNPSFMAYALATSFHHYSVDPGRNNTVPGQFSEWLHGETLTNQGMMLSPWFPPRYLWAAIEGAAGLDLSGSTPVVSPRLAQDWRWLGVRNLRLSGGSHSWFVARVPEERMYATFRFKQPQEYQPYDRDITAHVHATDATVVSIALERGDDVVLFVGNTTDRTVTTAVHVHGRSVGAFEVRTFSSLQGAWSDGGRLSSRDLERGIRVDLDRKGFCIMELVRTT